MTSERHDKKIQERHKMTMKDRKLPHRDITCLQKGAKQLKKRQNKLQKEAQNDSSTKKTQSAHRDAE